MTHSHCPPQRFGNSRSTNWCLSSAAETPFCSLSDVTNLRRSLWEAGFRPIAVYSRDKRPRGIDWANRARSNPPEAACSFAESSSFNTGILCDGLRAIDIDVDDELYAARLESLALELLGATFVRHRENSARRLLLYRAADGNPAKRVLRGARGQIEILGQGQQFVAHGLHPSGAPLHWRPVPLHAFAHRALTAVTEQQSAEFLVASADIIDAVPVKVMRGASPHPALPIARSYSLAPAKADARLRSLIRSVVEAPNGERNRRLYWASCRAGELVAMNGMDLAFVTAALTAAGTLVGLSIREAEATARSGIRAGSTVADDD
jgi:hypothetical protein